MAFKLVRKPFKVGTSVALTLPPDWCRYYSEQLRSVTILGNGVLIIAPEGLESKAQEIFDRMESAK